MPSQKPAKWIAATIVSITAIAILAVFTFRLFRDREPHVDPDRQRYPAIGIDISAHNGTKIDFAKAAQQGVTFAYLKASEGTDLRDPSFRRFITDAKSSSQIKIGAYHFFRFDKDGIEQARNFLEAIEDAPVDLPLAIDIEEWQNPSGISTELIISRLQAMIEHIAANRGHDIILYTNKNGYARFVKGHFDHLPLWICSFTDPPMPHPVWTIWQHSHKASVNGIKGPVDMNTINPEKPLKGL